MITNKPFVVNTVTYPYVYWDGFFSEIELNAIEEYCKAAESGELKDGVVVAKDGGEEKSDVRKSQVKFIQFGGENAWIFEKLNLISTHVNNNFYNYELVGYDFFQYTEYNKKGDKYGYHTDMIFGDSAVNGGLVVPRKLSFSLIISDSKDYKGGDFEFDTGNTEIAEQKRGRVLAFPSFVKHQVTPIKTGVRKSIVWWALGPKFK